MTCPWCGGEGSRECVECGAPLFDMTAYANALLASVAAAQGSGAQAPKDDENKETP